MLTTMIVLCLAGATPVQQQDKQALFNSPDIQVHQDFDLINEKKVLKNYLMFNKTYLGNNYLLTEKGTDFSRYATTYFHRKGPLGLALEKFNWLPGPTHTYWADARLPCSLIGLGATNPYAQLVAAWSEPPIAILSMGTGTTASYARPFQPIHFFERVPEFLNFSEPAKGKTPFFHFVRDAKLRGAHVKFFEGETRPTFEKLAGEKFYHLIQVETYKLASSTVLKELMTKEGIAMLMGKLDDDGILCFHTSNRYYNLATTIASAAQELGLYSLQASDLHYPHSDLSRFSSSWVMVAREPEVLIELARRTEPDSPRNDPERPRWSVDTWKAKQNVWRDGAANPFVKLNAANLLTSDATKRPPIPANGESILKVANGIEVITHQENVGAEPRLANRLMYKAITVGSNFQRPTNQKLWGDPRHDMSRLATTYYHRDGPLGLAMRPYQWFHGPVNTYRADARLPCSVVGLGAVGPFAQAMALWTEPPIAVLGMEAGTVASYARPLQTLHFVEREPAFVELSIYKDRWAPPFLYLLDAMLRGANIEVFDGEHRKTFAKHGAERFYRMIVVESYKESIRTVHKELMTKEGMGMLLSKLADDGVLCYHTSSRYYDMSPVIASVAESLGCATLHGKDQRPDEKDRVRYQSEWVLVARRADLLKSLAKHVPEGYNDWLRNQRGPREPFWTLDVGTKKSLVWTDAVENSFRGLHRSDPFIGDLFDLSYDLELAHAKLMPNQQVRARPIFELARSLLGQIEQRIVDSRNR